VSEPRVPVMVTSLRAAGCVFAEEEGQLLIAAARTPAELAAMVARRTAGFPLEQVLGWAEFCGLRMAVDEGVFVPPRRTELLVRHAAAAAEGSTEGDQLAFAVRCRREARTGRELISAIGMGTQPRSPLSSVRFSPFAFTSKPRCPAQATGNRYRRVPASGSASPAPVRSPARHEPRTPEQARPHERKRPPQPS
jgi:release factor glutamine methyltransferase